MIATLARCVAARPLLAPLAAFLASGALLAGAWAFQIWGGLAPCELCLWQRWPHYLVLALALVTATLLRSPGATGTKLRVLAAFIMMYAFDWATGAAIAGFHVGVEQHWWAGLQACGAGGIDGNLSLDALKAHILAAPVIRCDEVPWSLFGISLAGYNFLASAALALIALAVAFRLFATALAQETTTR